MEQDTKEAEEMKKQQAKAAEAKKVQEPHSTCNEFMLIDMSEVVNFFDDKESDRNSKA